MEEIEEEIIKHHENNIEQLKNQVINNTDINQKLIIKDKILSEQNYLIEIYKIKNTFGKKSKPLKKSKSENKKKYLKKKDTKLELKEIEIIEENPLTTNSFCYQNTETKIMTKYIKKIEKGNYIYFEYNKRKKGCNGKCKFKKNDKKWYLVENCDKNIIHDIYNYDKFYSDYDNKKLEYYNMSLKK